MTWKRILYLSLALGMGLPLAALVATENVSCFAHGDQGGTYNGNPLMAAVGCVVMDAVLAPGFLPRVDALGARLTDGLRTLSTRLGLGEVRGRGLLIAIDLKRDIGSRVVDLAREAGLLLNSPRANLLRLMPSLNVTEAEIDRMLAMTEAALVTVSYLVQQRLVFTGSPSRAGGRGGAGHTPSQRAHRDVEVVGQSRPTR